MARQPQPVARGRALRRGRRVKRIVRRIDLWSVLKLALVLYACLYAAVLLAVAGLWGFLNSAGLVDRFESFMRDIGFDRWEFHGADMFRGFALVGGILVLAGTVLTLLAMSLVNVVSELTGGIRFTVIEEELVMVRPGSGATASKKSRKGRKGKADSIRDEDSPTPDGNADPALKPAPPKRGRRRRAPESEPGPKVASPAGV